MFNALVSSKRGNNLKNTIEMSLANNLKSASDLALERRTGTSTSSTKHWTERSQTSVSEVYQKKNSVQRSSESIVDYVKSRPSYSNEASAKPTFRPSSLVPSKSENLKPHRRPNCELYKREICCVGIGQSEAIVDAQIQEMHGVPADVFLTSQISGSDRSWKNWVDDSVVAQQMKRLNRSYVRVRDGNDIGFELKWARCNEAAEQLYGDCERLRKISGQDVSISELSKRSQPCRDKNHDLNVNFDRLNKLEQVPNQNILPVRENLSYREMQTSSELCLSVCKNTVSSGIDTKSPYFDDFDKEAISVALYLRDDSCPLTSDRSLAQYKVKVIIDLSVILRADRRRFTVRGLFEGLVVEVIILGDSTGQDTRTPSQLADELSKLVLNKSPTLEGTQTLVKVQNIKVRGSASKARPLAFLMKNLEAQKPEIKSYYVAETNIEADFHDASNGLNALNDFDPQGNCLIGAINTSPVPSIFFDANTFKNEIEKNECLQKDEMSSDKRFSISFPTVQVAKTFAADSAIGHLNLSPGMRIALISTDGAGWCFGNILGKDDDRLFPAGWFPAECVLRLDSIDEHGSEFTLDSSSLDTSESLSESEILTVDLLHPSNISIVSRPALPCESTRSLTAENCTPSMLDNTCTGPDMKAQSGPFRCIHLQVVEGNSFPNAVTFGLLPDTYIAISLLRADQFHLNNLIIDHLVGCEPAVDDDLVHNKCIFRIPPQARTSVMERTKSPFWGETFSFYKSRPRFSVASEEDGSPKLVSEDLENDICGQDLILLLTLHERNLFGSDRWIARAELFISSLRVGETADTWLKLCHFDESVVVDNETAETARLRIRFEYSFISSSSHTGSEKKLNEVDKQSLDSRESRLGILESKQNQKSFACGYVSLTQSLSEKHDQVISACDEGHNSFDDWRLIPKLARKVAGLTSPKSKVSSKDWHHEHVICNNENSTSAYSSSQCSTLCDVHSYGSNLEGHSKTEKCAGMQGKEMSVCVEIDSISVANLRKNPANGLNPSPYLCISLVSNILLSHINAGQVNHPLRAVEQKYSSVQCELSFKYFEIQEQYRSAVIHRSQIPMWRSIFFLDEVIDISDEGIIGNNKCNVQSTRRPLVGQAITMLITIYDHVSGSKDRFLGKVLIPLESLGKEYNQKFNFLDLDGNLMDASQGYLWVSCNYKANRRELHGTTSGFDSDPASDFDLSATTSSTCVSDLSESFSIVSSGGQENRAQNGPVKTSHHLTFEVTSNNKEGCSGDSNLAESCQSEVSDCSPLRTNRSIETLCGVLEPVPSLIHGNSFESEQLLPQNSKDYHNSFDNQDTNWSQSFLISSVIEPRQAISNKLSAPVQSEFTDPSTVHYSNTSSHLLTFQTGLCPVVSTSELFTNGFLSSSDLEPSQSQSHQFRKPLEPSTFQRTTSEPYRTQNPATLLVTQKKPVKTQQDPVLLFSPDNQLRRSQSAQDWRSQNAKFRLIGMDGLKFEKSRMPYNTHEPSELEKAFMARKLIPTKDLTK